MIHIGGRSPERVRVVGALQSPALRLVLESRAGSGVVLDLSGVHEAEADAVRLVAGLSPDRCQLLDCPAWLTPWIERERRSLGRNQEAKQGGRSDAYES